MSFKFGKRGGIYKLQDGKKVYLRKKTKKQVPNKFGLQMTANIEIKDPIKLKIYNSFIDILKKIEMKSGSEIVVFNFNIIKTIMNVSDTLQFWETMISQRKGKLPVNVNSDIVKEVIPIMVLKTSGDDLSTILDYNSTDLEQIIKVLTKHYNRIFIKYLKK